MDKWAGLAGAGLFRGKKVSKFPFFFFLFTEAFLSTTKRTDAEAVAYHLDCCRLLLSPNHLPRLLSPSSAVEAEHSFPQL